MKGERKPLLTRQTMVILSILMGDAQPLAGSAIASMSGLASGTLYPVLIRLEKARWIKSEWEENEADSKKPRRRLYSMTALGVQGAREEATAWKPLVECFV